MTPKEVGALVLSERFVMAEAVQQVTPDEVRDTIARAEHEAQPLARTELGYAHPERRSERVNAIRQALRLIGAKVKPDMGGDAAVMWVDALVVSLSKWPASVVKSATQAAVTEPFEFLNKVDGRLHELCAEHEERARTALLRLRRMHDEIERAANPPQPQIAAPEEEPWTQGRIDSANANFAKFGVSIRYRLGADGQPEPAADEPAE